MSIDPNNINKVKLGKYAGFSNQGTNAIAIGNNAGYTNQGSNSICLGYNSSSINSSNSITIGSNSSSKPNISNQLVIGFDASNNSYGGIYAENLGSNNIKVGINTNNPNGTLDISGIVRIGNKFRYDISFNNTINTIKYSSNDNSIYVGGDFNSVLVNGITTNNLGRICRISLDDGSVNDMNGGLNGSCHTIAIDSLNNVYVGGNFKIVGGIPANYIAKWNPTTSSWSPLGDDPLVILDNGFNNKCETIAIDSDDNVYAGGFFTKLGDDITDMKRIAKWNGSSWSALGDGLNSTCYTIAIDSDDNVYAGGNFNDKGNFIAKWNGSWGPLGDGLFSVCLTIAIDSKNNVYAGGNFTKLGDDITDMKRIAKWNPTTSSWSALGDGLNSTCYTIAIDSDDNVYAGGDFTTAGGNPAKKIAKWNGSSWGPLGDGLNDRCKTIAIDSFNDIYAGGEFTEAYGKSVGYFGYYDIWIYANLYSSVIMGIKGDTYIDGNVNIKGKLKVSGNKTFIIDHPIDNDKYLVHACLEGPEAGVYYRGIGKINENEKMTIINLPNYVDAFAKDLQAIVSLICDDGENMCNLCVSTVSNGSFKVFRNPILNSDTHFNWIVTGKRNDIVVEPYKNDVIVKGDGPYKYI